MGVLKDVVTGGIFSKDEDDAAQDYLNQMLAQYNNIALPNLNNPEQYKSVGSITPEVIAAGPDVQARTVNPVLASGVDEGPSAFEGIALDPALRQKQEASLAALDDIAANGGLTAKDKANLARIQSETATADKGRRDAILQNMGARGMGGSSMELLAQLQSNQAATDRASQAGLDVAGSAEQRALDAIMQSGQLAGNLRNQDYQQEAQKAEARDAIARFNAQNRNQLNQYNTGVQNQANQYNATNQMGMDRYNRDARLDVDRANAGARTAANAGNLSAMQDAANRNTQQANAIPQQNFENQMAIANGKQNGLATAFNSANQKSAQARGSFQGLFNEGFKGAQNLAKKG